MREEFEKQLMRNLLAKFEINKDFLEIDYAVKKNGLNRLDNIKKSLFALKLAAKKQMLFFLFIKAKLLYLVHI